MKRNFSGSRKQLRRRRDQLYPVKVDNANRTAILDQEGNILPGAAGVLVKENSVSIVSIAKIAWLSRKDAGKAYPNHSIASGLVSGTND